MDLDSDLEMRDDIGDSHRAKRRPEDPDKAKVRLVTGPEREDFDNARSKESYHKEQASLARQKSQKLTLANQQLVADLAAAEKLKAEHIASMNSMQQQLNKMHQEILNMQRHEGQMEAQFLGDQGKIQALYDQCNTMVPQLLESHKLLIERNEDVDRLNRLLVQTKDETIQLRAFNYLQSKKTPQSTPPPRRGTRASLDPARNSSTRTIKIPLDPIPVIRAPSDKSAPKPKAKLTATPGLADLLGTDVATLSGLVGKLERLLVSDDVTVNVEKTTSKKTTSKKTTPKKTTPKKTTPKKVRPDTETMHYIHRVLRKVTYDKFNIEQAADFQIYNPADESNVTACDDGLGDPADDVFQWDFSSGYTESRWNKLMTAKIVDQVLEDDGEDGPLAEAGIERGFLEELMADKLVRYRGEWKRFQPRYTESLGRVETTQEARARGAQAFQQHQLATRSTSSKHRKYEDRVQTITATVEIKRESGIALDVETWERLLEIVEHLGEQGMSSEEEDEIEVDDGKVLVYRVKLCIWREPRIVEYFRFVDAQTALFKKHQRGPTAATRIRSGAHGSSKAPCGLPKSLYNSEWLKKATPSYLKELKVSKEAFELFVAATNRMEL